MKRFVFTLVSCLAFTSWCYSQPKIWSCVVYAKSGKGEIDPALNSYTNDMQRIFGYCHYEIIGSQWSTKSIHHENWLMPTKEFFLKITPLTNWNNASQLEMELYQEKEVLLKTQFRMPYESPLYIAGPSFGKGKLIFILEAKSDADNRY